jgi:SAM-dependent methyltransferase
MEFNVKEKVKEYYGGIAKTVDSDTKGSCCSVSSCCGSSKEPLLYKGQNLSDLPIEAVNASLGCGNPLVLAGLKEGETVLDLGSGGGIDVLLASRYVGGTGKVYGLDMTDEMLELSYKNKRRMGVENVEFLKGYIEDIPIADDAIDVIMSNCVINLSEDKPKALSEAYRVLKNGGRLAISDIVVLKEVPGELRKRAELWAGCIAGALKVDEYVRILEQVGFKNIEIKPVHIYTRAVIEDLTGRKADFLSEKEMEYLDSLDGAYAGAYIRATK